MRTIPDSNPRPENNALGSKTTAPRICLQEKKKTGSFSLIERVILSAGAMLIFSVSFQIDQMPEGIRYPLIVNDIEAPDCSCRSSLVGRELL